MKRKWDFFSFLLEKLKKEEERKK
jgi:hypothetical protein